MHAKAQRFSVLQALRATSLCCTHPSCPAPASPPYLAGSGEVSARPGVVRLMSEAQASSAALRFHTCIGV